MTQKQKAILKHLAAAKTAARVVTVDELVETLGAGSSKQAMQCSLRFLERKLFLERQYVLLQGRHHLVLELTGSGYTLGCALSS